MIAKSSNTYGRTQTWTARCRHAENRVVPACLLRLNPTSALIWTRNRCAPLPLWGGLGRGLPEQRKNSQASLSANCRLAYRLDSNAWDPHPSPSPQGGGEQTELAVRTDPISTGTALVPQPEVRTQSAASAVANFGIGTLAGDLLPLTVNDHRHRSTVLPALHSRRPRARARQGRLRGRRHDLDPAARADDAAVAGGGDPAADPPHPGRHLGLVLSPGVERLESQGAAAGLGGRGRPGLAVRGLRGERLCARSRSA